jgi:hypothetical protein
MIAVTSSSEELEARSTNIVREMTQRSGPGITNTAGERALVSARFVRHCGTDLRQTLAASALESTSRQNNPTSR